MIREDHIVLSTTAVPEISYGGGEKFTIENDLLDRFKADFGAPYVYCRVTILISYEAEGPKLIDFDATEARFKIDYMSRADEDSANPRKVNKSGA